MTPHEGSGSTVPPVRRCRTTNVGCAVARSLRPRCHPSHHVSSSCRCRPATLEVALEDSPSGLWRTLGKRVGCKPSGVRIPHPPPRLRALSHAFRLGALRRIGRCGIREEERGTSDDGSPILRPNFRPHRARANPFESRTRVGSHTQLPAPGFERAKGIPTAPVAGAIGAGRLRLGPFHLGPFRLGPLPCALFRLGSFRPSRSDFRWRPLHHLLT